jgi:hypothetical protein
MRLTQSEFHYEDGDTSYAVREILPSAPYGGWPGNAETVRVWTVCRPGEAACRCPSDAELRELEARVGTYRAGSIHLDDHPTLGRVVVIRPD